MPARGLRRQIQSLLQNSRASRHKARARFTPLSETLEDRKLLTLTSDVTAGVLTVTSSFDDPITVSASASGNVLVNGADPGTGTAAASAITQISIQGGPGVNLIDVSSLTPAVFTGLTNIGVNGGGGSDTFSFNSSFAGTYDSDGAPVTMNIVGIATNSTLDGNADTLTNDGTVLSLINPTGTINDLIHTQNLTGLVPNGGNFTIGDGPNPGNGVSSTTQANAPFAFNFLNPTTSLTIAATGGNTTIVFDGLDTVGLPAGVTIDAGTTGSTALSFNGAVVNSTFDVATRTLTRDGLPIKMVNQAASVVDNTLSRNLTINLASNAQETVDAGPTPGDTYSRITNQTTGKSYSFLNPTNAFTVNATGGTSSITYDGLDSGSVPALVTLNGGPGTTSLGLNAAAQNVTLDFASRIATFDGSSVLIPNFVSVSDQAIAAHLSLILPGGVDATLSDGFIPGAGVSLLTNPSLSLLAAFQNPSQSLVVEANGARSFTYAGIDTSGRPTNVLFDAGPTRTPLTLTGTATNLVLDYAHSTITQDGLAIGFANTANIFDQVVATNLTIIGHSSVPEVVSDDPTSANGFSQIIAPTLGVLTTFPNPAGTLTVQGTGNTMLTYEGLDTASKVGSVNFIGTGNNVFNVSLPGKFKRVVYNSNVDPTISFDGSLVSYSNFVGVHDTTIASSRTFLLPNSGSTQILSDDPIPNDGVSRLITSPGGPFIDFLNPTSTINISGGPKNDLLYFYGLDTVGQPKTLLFNGNGGRNAFFHVGSAPFTHYRIQHARIVHLPKRALPQ